MQKTKMGPIAILNKFFGRQPNQNLKEFNAELKALSPEEKKELVTLAAVELKTEVDWPVVTKPVATKPVATKPVAT